MDEIPEGLVLLPAPRPYPRWRGPALAATSFLAAAVAGLIAINAAQGPSVSGEEPPLQSGQAELAATTSEESDRDADVDADASQSAERASSPAASGEQPAAAPATAPPPVAAPSGPTPAAPADEALNASTEDEPAATGADEEATIASGGSTDGDPEPPPADTGESGSVTPDPGQAIDTVGDIVEDVTESLPIPDVIGNRTNP